MKPSFYSLFKRGKYYHRKPLLSHGGRAAGTLQDEQEHREIERFCVAAIAFCFQYDACFRQHFWERICKLGEDPWLQEWSIDIEPSDWCDLVIHNRSNAKNYVYAVECKVAAKLEDHQNPDEDAFGEPGGYGFSLSGTESADAAIRYTVLGYRPYLSLTRRHEKSRVAVQQKFWRDIESGYEPSGITLALFHSLGYLGIREFSHRMTNTTKITSDLEAAANASRLLQDVTEKLGLIRDYSRLEPWSEDRGDWHFGIDIAKLPPKQGKSENQRRLAELVEPMDTAIAWFGYEPHPITKPRLSVWFYCSKTKLAEKLAAKLKPNFENVQCDEGKGSGATNVIVWVVNHDLPGDRDWFISVFEAIGLQSVT